MRPINQFLSVLKFRQPSSSSDVLSPDAFQTVLNTERARSDRSGWPFTLVVIKVARPEQAQGITNLLLDVVQERTRQIDYKGWYDGDLGLILPYTHADNAAHVLNAIEDRFTTRARKNAGDIGLRPELEYTVYCYPPSLDRKVETV